MEFKEISAHDEFVDSWTETTKGKSNNSYLITLRRAGLLDEKTEKQHTIKLDAEDFTYYAKFDNVLGKIK